MLTGVVPLSHGRTREVAFVSGIAYNENGLDPDNSGGFREETGLESEWCAEWLSTENLSALLGTCLGVVNAEAR
jgi:hypothetical protein